ncbi:Angiopoietin-related protein 1 [Holothuria leucospilota]|uniref:Angiopoietin-related protein 1 n=1 Tax=Holothuria leucospilota TaxID=206669 RepID=A0A9Q1BWG2_HOLLE|nr:Angiopoietin-related protein 1 [Holothuria leucospilota]
MDGHDSMRHHVNARFSTHNRDNDGWGADSCDFNGHCAEMHEGGWWYKHRSRYEHSGCNLKPTGCRKRRWQSCAKCNLNGVYRGGDGTNIFWDGIPGPGCHLRFVEMKLLSV